jgi:hypothetical protein
MSRVTRAVSRHSGRCKGQISAEAAASRILDRAATRSAEIDVGATELLRSITRSSPTPGERITIGR